MNNQNALYNCESYEDDCPRMRRDLVIDVRMGVGPQGPRGEQGEKGDPPVRGEDYWTEEDKAEIISTVETDVAGDVESAVERAVAAKDAAETAKTEAQAAQVIAADWAASATTKAGEAAASAATAVAYCNSAETFKDLAQAAKTAADSAKTAAEGYVEDAEQYATAAISASEDASVYALSAQMSDSNITNNSIPAIEAIKADTEDIKDEAEEHRDNAINAASHAEQYAEAAAGHLAEVVANTTLSYQYKEDAISAAANAEAAILTVQGYVEDAEAQAEAAATSATEAATYAENAAAMAEDASESAEKIIGLTVTAETLPEGSAASANYDSTSGELTLGIPKGNPGPQGDPGDDYVLTQEDKEEIAGQISTDIEDQLNELLDALPESTVGPAASVSVSDALPIRPRELTVKLAATQSGSGDPSPENIRPISGTTGLTLTHTVDEESTVWPVSWESEAGTVYGGTLDFTNGTLTVTHTKLAINAATIEKVMDITNKESGNRCAFEITHSITLEHNIDEGLLCNIAKADASVNLTNARWVPYTCALYKNNLNERSYFRYVFPTTITTSEAALEYLIANHCEITYPLIEPIVYHVDPVSIRLERGLNTITTDVGEITLRYVQEQTESVTDVQVNSTSIVENSVANVPIATSNTPGVVTVKDGLFVGSAGNLYINRALDAQIKAAADDYRPIVPRRQHISAFYGLAKAAGDTSQSASSNAVGAYTDEAKVAIQKMLGIYEAPWELIREDTVTNDTEADIIINADSNGQTFELTDVRLVLVSPQQDTAFSKADYGRVRFYYQAGAYDFIFIGAYTQAANVSAKVSYIAFEQSDGMLVRSVMPNTSRGGMGPLQTYATEDGEGYFVLTDTPRVYNKISITKVTGKLHYILYGRRK